MILGVVHQVKVDELLLLQIVRLHVLEDVREEGRHILGLCLLSGAFPARRALVFTLPTVIDAIVFLIASLRTEA